jgi:hypothetical protein
MPIVDDQKHRAVPWPKSATTTRPRTYAEVTAAGSETSAGHAQVTSAPTAKSAVNLKSASDFDIDFPRLPVASDRSCRVFNSTVDDGARNVQAKVAWIRC